MKRLLLYLCVLFALNPIIVCSTALMDNSTYNFFYNKKSLRAVLTECATNSGLAVHFDQSVYNVTQQTVNGRFIVDNRTQLLDKLSSIYGFDWFKFSGVLYITDNKLITKTISLDPGVINSLTQYLREIKLISDKFSVNTLSNEDKIIVSGPATYVDLVLQHIKDLGLRPMAEQFMMYRLKFANADDTVFFVNNQQSTNSSVVSNQNIVVPGVASVLRAVLAGDGRGLGGSGGYVPLSPDIAENIEKLKGKLNAEPELDKVTERPARLSLPVIQADRRTNSVVIKDKVANLAIYQSLIDMLDVPTPVIQIDVITISVNQDKIHTLETSWSGTVNGVGLGWNSSHIQNMMATVGVGGNPIQNQTVIGDVTGFMLGVNFLEENGAAKTISKPSLLTLDNLPAIISSNDSVYLLNSGATAGSSSSNASQISSGGQAHIATALTIIPHVVNYADKSSQISLSISLQDGSVNTGPSIIAGVPVITQGNINTQAILINGQAILLAGYNRSSSEVVQTKVPFLGDIPLIGLLFKSSRNVEYQKRVFYLVVPRILDIKHPNNITKDIKDIVTGKSKDFQLNDSQRMLIDQSSIQYNDMPSKSESPTAQHEEEKWLVVRHKASDTLSANTEIFNYDQ